MAISLLEDDDNDDDDGNDNDDNEEFIIKCELRSELRALNSYLSFS